MDKSLSFISYQDDNGQIISGYVDVLEINPSYVKIRTTKGNVILLPMNRILKIKLRGDF